MEYTIGRKTVTYDFERLMDGAQKVSTSQFAKLIVKNMDHVAAHAGNNHHHGAHE
jgi:isocitrate dehydrogenase